MRNKFYWLVLLLLLVIFSVSFMLSAYGANYTLYASVSPTDSIVNNLIGLYLNSEGYDPYNQYFCCRVGQWDYILFYGKDLTGEVDYFRYTGSLVGNQMHYEYSIGSDNHINISYNNFIGVGNVPGSIQSDRHTQFGFGYVITVLVILIAILFIFKTFKKVYRPRSDRGYTL